MEHEDLMRARRYTAPATPTQAARRQQWATYLSTRAWRTRRAQWITSGHANTTCPGCGQLLDPHRADVHHLAYPAVPGTETDDDLILLCRGCHEAVHASIDASRAWRHTTRRVATISILATLRTRHNELSTGTRPSSTAPPTRAPLPSEVFEDGQPESREDTP